MPPHMPMFPQIVLLVMIEVLSAADGAEAPIVGDGVAADGGVVQCERAGVGVVQGAARPVGVVASERAGGDRCRAGVVEAAAFASPVVADGGVVQRERAGVGDPAARVAPAVTDRQAGDA